MIALLLSGCPSAGEKPAKQPTAGQTKTAAEARPKSETQQPPAGTEAAAKPESPEKDLSQELEEVAEKPRDLGPPLVDDPGKLVRLDPKQPVWIDKPNKQVVLLGEVCKAGYPLEFFATYSNRSYEAVMAVNVTPSIVHAGLLAIGAEAGPSGPVRAEPFVGRFPAGHRNRHRAALEGPAGQGPVGPRPALDPQHQDQEGIGLQLGIRRQHVPD